MGASLTSLSEHFVRSLTFSSIDRAERSVRVGETSKYLTFMFQIAEGAITFKYIKEAMGSTNLPSLYWAEKIVVYGTPLLTTFLGSSTSIPQGVRTCSRFIRDNLGSLHQTAAIISSISLIFFGQALVGALSLSILGIGVMDCNGWISSEYRQAFHTYTQPLVIASGLISGNIIYQISAILNFLVWCSQRFPSTLNDDIPTENFIIKGNLTVEQAKQFLENKLTVEIDPNYIHYDPLPKVPDIDIQSILGQFNQVDWKKKENLNALRKKLDPDDRFRAAFGIVAATNDEIITYATEALTRLITEVKNNKILEGEPTNYTKIQNYLAIIAEYLQVKRDELTEIEDQEERKKLETHLVDILLRLAVEAGGYCGPGRYRAIEAIYIEAIRHKKDIPFSDKVMYCLQSARTEWFQRFYSNNFIDNAVLKAMPINYSDVHIYNVFANHYARRLNLFRASVENDETAFTEPLFMWFTHQTLGRVYRNIFWEEVTKEEHLSIIADYLGSPCLPLGEFFSFFQGWITRQDIDQDVKDELLNELTDASLFGRKIEGSHLDKFISLMLLDLGILKPVPKSTDSEKMLVH